ncbi:DUF6266 family protein [Halosquirtibacter xylanolyticus]|uniref:DUF6266 family protein n=1 Tax=Halosquirtibacter xylanolyticus TaxID=3374599 RepID=UPI003748EB69|nr:DUF6266 family protein [Prolixibacteraceae bacterium]
MALIKKNHISGIVGPVVCYQVRGKGVIRSRPQHIDRKTPKQLAQRMKMKLTIDFLHNLREIVRLSFPSTKAFVNGHVLARSRILKTPFLGEYPHLEMNYSEILLSSDPQSGLEDITTTYDGEHLSLHLKLHPKWENKKLPFYLIQQAEESDVSTNVHGPFQYDATCQCECILPSRSYYRSNQHFWLMLFDPLHSHFYGSCYFELSIDDTMPQTFTFNS